MLPIVVMLRCFNECRADAVNRVIRCLELAVTEGVKLELAVCVELSLGPCDYLLASWSLQVKLIFQIPTWNSCATFLLQEGERFLGVSIAFNRLVNRDTLNAQSAGLRLCPELVSIVDHIMAGLPLAG